ncbi:MAG: gamma-glutamyl-gamma-aminobutyrate hydrolase family protein [Rhodospirillaceae bacterium]|jgi:putative glutamine amidotransferase|nr:gamma-glutamyl-gamma-aminobutyrate hydrolase family protein [Rhodospirillaceae bacterium]MBT3908192.1 gamma-glutamyl-gamma-aminobutyrate hydrolase family protein [Rhodospirillaceae bacterium]MBT5299934.1 gamma-glutamyl-gamma-aminobutyrate hydrolase family protein [Rhodospirillaceae bacterium]MBT5513096.1 gamma-glutamyl-gamma-aminobutyrate hydrolase family protein [Rhodospirillaceae bacterium]MBT6087460.1 gamma-glutamyl-gamma-aminobutyrate hydrolase family protein [Rhodospirillaceae bacterium
MSKPVVGVSASTLLVNGQYQTQAAGSRYLEAITEVAGAQSMIIPALPHCVDLNEIMSICDGFVFTGGRANVHPDEYGHAETEAHGDFDRGRDGVVLPLIRACIDAGQPVLGVCRGFQEFNVAMGGTLHPEIRDLPGRMNHRMPPDGTIEEKFAHRHMVHLNEGSPFIPLFGADEVLVNSLHGQGIEEAGPRVSVEGHAPDGTPEALVIKDAPGFAMAVQWHPEYNAANDPVSKPLFEAFGQALMAWKKGIAHAAE